MVVCFRLRTIKNVFIGVARFRYQWLLEICDCNSFTKIMHLQKNISFFLNGFVLFLHAAWAVKYVFPHYVNVSVFIQFSHMIRFN